MFALCLFLQFSFLLFPPFFALSFFVDIRLYNKARSAIEPFAFEKYRKEKIRQQIDATRPARLKIKTNLPAVNQELALKYMDNDDDDQRRKQSTKSNLLQDDRFKALFTNPEFEVDKNADEYKMLTPVLSRLEKGKVKELKRKALTSAAIMPFMEDDDGGAAANGDKTKITDDDDLFGIEKDQDDGDAQSSSDDDDDRVWQKDLKSTYRQLRKEQKAKRFAEEQDSDNESADNDTTMPEVKRSANSANLEFKVKNITTKSNK